MELFFRKYFWTVNLAFLALAALLVARTGNVFVAAALAPKSDARTDGGKKEKSPVGRLATTPMMDANSTARIFGVELPKPEEAPAPEPTANLDGEPVKSSLRATLIGTMVSNRPEWSLATLRDDNTQDVGAFLVGERFMNAEILEIERLRVILLNEGRKEYLALHDDAAPAPPPPVPQTASTSPEGSDEGVEKIDENNFNISRSKIDEQLANMSQLATQARIVPSFKDGVANGFKLFSIRPGSLYSQIGIQNGDVIRRINGYEINSPDKALEVYAKLKESSKIEIELERRGTPQKKTYNIR